MTHSDTKTSPDTRRLNRLGREKSPYLLQHARNPVDWFPWGEEAFEKARREDKPIFLSIGYSTCHWCHVMERESFENEAVAELLNRDFVPVKVDREERPDVDRVYMTAMQALGSGGGWPLNVFLTPELEPFFGGTYFPPDGMQGRAGMLQILPRVQAAWREQKDQVRATGQHVIEALTAYGTTEPGIADRAPLLARCYQSLASTRDSLHGGFGNAPKFPTIPNLNFLFRWWRRDPAAHEPALAMALAQLDAMRRGGIHDHLGGGFHRYATDAEWLVPHFEKMLYDQAQIAWAYLDAFQITRRAEYAATARDLFAYVARDLTSSEGAFLSAEDADSEGEEGRFYVWTSAETRAALGEEDAALFDFHYGVSEDGNFEHGTTILSEVHSIDETARAHRIDPDEVARRLAAARAKLLAVRAERVRPHRDDKVITAWNGLMISAFARGARVLGDPSLARHAAAAAGFVWSTLWNDASGELRRRWREQETAIAGQLDDHAYLALGMIDLYAATFDPPWLERAARVVEALVARFWDGGEGGFFDSPAGDPGVRLRMKDEFDGAEMAGNSIAAFVLITLGTLLDRREWREQAEATLDLYARRLERYPVAMPQMMVALDRAESPARHVVVAGDLGAPDTRALIAEFDRRWLPHDLLIVVDGGDSQARLARLAPFVAPLTRQGGRATAYVCVDYTCRLPTTDPETFAAQLDAPPI